MQVFVKLGEIVEKHDTIFIMINKCLQQTFNRHVDELFRIRKSMTRMINGHKIM